MIGLTVYDKIPHRKSHDLIFGLIGLDINFGIIPQEFTPRPFKPLYKHRPDPVFDVTVGHLAGRLRIPVVQPEECDAILIGGANILGSPYTDKIKTINGHPGYLPNARGLDALKWAIIEQQPIGVTTHVITNEPDTGYLIEQQIIEPEVTEGFFEFSMRLYALEINMMLNALHLPVLGKIEPYHYQVHKRMPPGIEMGLLDKFLRRKA